MNFDKYTIKSQEALQKSAEIATSNQQQAIEAGHLLEAIMETDQNVSGYLVKKLNISETILRDKLEEIIKSYPKATGQQPYLSTTVNSILQMAEKEMRSFGDSYVAVEHLLIAILGTKDKVASLMKEISRLLPRVATHPDH
jgi:ATP-dependent Clp protease ATP-binding subunit ClpB